MASSINTARHITIEDQPGSSSHLPNFTNEVLVPGTIQHGNPHLLDGLALGFSQSSDVLPDRFLDVDNTNALMGRHDLPHIENAGRIEHGATICYCNHRNGVGASRSCEGGPIDRIHRNV